MLLCLNSSLERFRLHVNIHRAPHWCWRWLPWWQVVSVALKATELSISIGQCKTQDREEGKAGLICLLNTNPFCLLMLLKTFCMHSWNQMQRFAKHPQRQLKGLFKKISFHINCFLHLINPNIDFFFFKCKEQTFTLCLFSVAAWKLTVLQGSLRSADLIYATAQFGSCYIFELIVL